jgi:methylmalonyl-CoA/ethylmalonyl-CoA epimerase
MANGLNKKIFQVLIVVKDVQKSARQFADTFGLDVPEAVILDPEEIAHAKYRGKPTRTRAKVIPFMNMGGIDVEMIEPDEHPSIWREFLDTKGEGVSHLGIWVPNMSEAVGYLAGKGVAIGHQASFVGGSYSIMDMHARMGVDLMLKHQD